MICLICESKTKTYKHPKFHITFHECLHCEAIFKDKKHFITKEEEKDIYDLHQNTLDNEGYVNYLDDFIQKAVVPFKETYQSSALDFGSGPGPVLAHLLKEKYHAKVNIYDPFYAPNDTYVHQTYDLITTTEVFEHLKDPIQTLNALKALLKPDGIISIMTLFHPKDQIKFFDWFYIRDESHIVFFTPKTFQVMANLCHLKLIYCNHHRMITLKKDIENGR